MNFNIHQKGIEKINKTEEKKIIIFSEKKYTKEASVLYKVIQMCVANVQRLLQ